MADIKVKRVEARKNSYYVVKIFEGIFAKISTQLPTDKMIKLEINQNSKKYNKNRIEFENIEFEKNFDIYCEDRQLALMIFTPDTIEMLMDFYKKYELKFEINIIQNDIYIKFFTGEMFEPGVIKEALDENMMFVYYSVLKFILDFTSEVTKSFENKKI